tara:strand:- start:27 stop:503 length:477 start_codon:yes stop_codon:yes gene_type:complete
MEEEEEKFILDACCGGRSFWFNKNHPNAIYLDRRNEEHQLDYERNKQHIVISPDVVGDFTDLPFEDKSFSLVVFDPPHAKFSESSIMYKKYGTLDNDWAEDIKKGFSECFRVLDDRGVLIFKWAESRYKVSEMIPLAGREPLFGHKTSRTNMWLTFLK